MNMSILSTQISRRISRRISRLSFGTILLSIITACGGAGGDSGSNLPDNVAIAAVEPLVGIWELPGDWNGTSDDEAYLVIDSPDNDGVSVATIYDLDDAIAGAERNCYLTDDKGEVSQSLTNDLFLDLPVYNSAIAKLLPNEVLEISVFADGANSSSTPERVFTATRVTSITVNELPLC